LSNALVSRKFFERHNKSHDVQIWAAWNFEHQRREDERWAGKQLKIGKVCTKSVQKKLHENVGRETLKIGKNSLSGQRIPNSTGVRESKDREQAPLRARVLGFCREGVHEKVGMETLKIGKVCTKTRMEGCTKSVFEMVGRDWMGSLNGAALNK
jgi:hypothetical protein